MYRGKFERQEAVSRKRGPGSLIFYTVYFACCLALWIGIYSGLGWLRGWLVDFQAAQPDTVCQLVFRELFSQPDWGALYDLAGEQGTPWEGREAYVRAMETQTAGQILYMQETSAGLSGDRKYLVLHQGQTVAAFTLTQETAGETDRTPQWKLGTLTLFADGSESYCVTAPEGARVLVNGRELDEGHLVSVTASSAGEYLPTGVRPAGSCTYRVEGLLLPPEVRVLTEDDRELETVFDEAAGTFTSRKEEAEIGEAERETALKAARTYALYMIKKAGAGELAKYFNPASDTYREITGVTLSFVQEAAKREFTEESVSEYCRYSENLFSVRVKLNLKLYRSDGSTKDNPLDRYLFFSRESGGKWLCYAMTAVDISRQQTSVRLTFCQGETVLLSEFFPEDNREIQCPVPAVPTGKTFSGWTVEETGENGETVLRLIFTPDADGKVTLPADTLLTPMTLQPLFE